MKAVIFLATLTWSGLWFTPDQQGKRHFERGEFVEAAEAFQDPLWQGMALYRDGEFEKAARAFARRDTPEALFDQGNAWLMNGKYEAAIACYERVLTNRPDWKEAQENRDLAAARAALVKNEGGDMGDQTLGADEIKFDTKKHDSGQDTEVNMEQTTTDQSVQALWLRRVQTKPADFLKAKFSYQEAMKGEGGE